MQGIKLNRWCILIIAGLFFHYEFFQINMFNALEPELAKTFGISPSELGWLSATYFYGTIVLLLPAGLILDRVSVRHLILFAMSMTLIGTLFFSFATHVWMAAAGRFAVGLCAGPFALISVIKLATRWFAPKELSLVTGVAVSMGMLGGILAQTPFHLLVQAIGWRQALHVNVLVGFVMLALIWLFVYEPDKKPEHHNNSEELQSLGTALRLVASKMHNWKIGLYASLVNLPIFILGSLFSTLYLTGAHGLTALQASYAAMMIFIGMLLGCPFFGWISVAMERRKVPMIAGAVLALIVSLTVMFSEPSFSQILVLFFLIGFGVSAHTLVYPSVAESNTEKTIGAAEGLAAMLIMAGGAVFQPLCGWLLELPWDGRVLNGVPVYSDTSYLFCMSVIPIALVLGIALVMTTKESFPR